MKMRILKQDSILSQWLQRTIWTSVRITLQLGCTTNQETRKCSVAYKRRLERGNLKCDNSCTWWGT